MSTLTPAFDAPNSLDATDKFNKSFLHAAGMLVIANFVRVVRREVSPSGTPIYRASNSMTLMAYSEDKNTQVIIDLAADMKLTKALWDLAFRGEGAKIKRRGITFEFCWTHGKSIL
jgi:hypothetical protein